MLHPLEFSEFSDVIYEYDLAISWKETFLPIQVVALITNVLCSMFIDSEAYLT